MTFLTTRVLRRSVLAVLVVTAASYRTNEAIAKIEIVKAGSDPLEAPNLPCGKVASLKGRRSERNELIALAQRHASTQSSNHVIANHADMAACLDRIVTDVAKDHEGMAFGRIYDCLTRVAL